MSSSLFQVFLRNHRLCLQKTNNLYLPCSTIPNRQKSDKSGKTSDLGSSTILLQDGPNVQELPLIVRKIKNILIPMDNKIECASGYATKFTGENDIHKMIHKEFSRCKTLNDVITLLSKCSTITPNIALGAVERIYDIQDNLPNGSSGSACSVNVLSNVEFLDKLIDIIKQNDDIYALLRCLKAISIRNDQYVSSICDEILVRVTDNKVSIGQLCDVVSFFSTNKHIDKFSEHIDKLWVGFIEREKEFNEENIVKCFTILHHLQTSRKVVLGVLEKRLLTWWWQMKSDSVIEVLSALSKIKVTSSRIFPVLGRWLNTNIHVLSEDILLQLVAKFSQIGYTDLQVEKALERYVKVKGLKIESSMLWVTIMNHCTLFRIRNIHILGGCVEYFLLNGRSLEPMFLKPLFYPLGYLNYQPNNRAKFWQELESVFEKKFVKISVEDVLDIMLTCVYLEKYPLNFIPKVFNPNFLERINLAPNAPVLRNKLKLLDTAMNLECAAYNGPLLPKDHTSKSLWSDGRVKRIVNFIRESIEAVAGGPECFSTFVVLPRVFLNDLYIVDVMIHPKGLRSSMLSLNLKKDYNVNVALLIHLPEHFNSNGETLLGPQIMRIKHLRILGLKVVTLKYETISRLSMHRAELEKYIVSRLKLAQEAL